MAISLGFALVLLRIKYAERREAFEYGATALYPDCVNSFLNHCLRQKA
jgi:hypothetical protein